MKNNQNTPLLLSDGYGIIWAFLERERLAKRTQQKTENRKETMPNEEMMAELNAQLTIKETRVRKLARLAGELPLKRENLPALECYALEMRSLAYQIRQLLVAKAAALAAM